MTIMEDKKDITITNVRYDMIYTLLLICEKGNSIDNL